MKWRHCACYTLLPFLLLACTSSSPVMETSNSMATGITATPLCDVAESKIVCNDRLAAAQLTPVPPSPPSPLFLTQEAEFYQRVEILRLTPSPIWPTPTDTHQPKMMPAQQAGFLIFQISSGYQQYPQFQVTYASADWEKPDNNFYLNHRHLLHCKLALAAGGRDMQSPIIDAGRAELAGKSWKTTFYPTEGEFSYGWGFENKFYLFNVIMTPNPSDETVKACRTAVEAVLNTFVLVQEK